MLSRLKLKKTLLAMSVFALFCGVVTPAFAINYCTSDECKKAQSRETELNKKATEATEVADTLEAKIAELNSEIAELEASIATNEAIAKDLTEQIEATEAKLNSDQEALAEMLIDMHFSGNSEPIRILASASSISDLAKKQAREEVVKQEIAAVSAEVKELKAELETQRETIKELIAEQSSKRAEASSKRAEQIALEEKYRNNADAYAADAEKARLEKEKLIADEIAKYNSGGTVVAFGTDTYPYAYRCPADNLKFAAYGGYGCQCTSYAGWKAYERWGVVVSGWGNAKYWGWYTGSDGRLYPRSSIAGHTVNTTPAVNTVAVTSGGAYGHVMWVESVNSDGTINLTEYNNSGSVINYPKGTKGAFGSRMNVSTSGMRFIHFDY